MIQGYTGAREREREINREHRINRINRISRENREKISREVFFFFFCDERDSVLRERTPLVVTSFLRHTSLMTSSLHLFCFNFFFCCFNDLGFSDLGPNAAMPRLKCPDALWSEKEKRMKNFKF